MNDRLERVDASLARQLSESIARNAKLRKAITDAIQAIDDEQEDIAYLVLKNAVT